jgi:hypothetical protein
MKLIRLAAYFAMAPASALLQNRSDGRRRFRHSLEEAQGGSDLRAAGVG